MKTIHTINKVIIIINLVLFLTFWGGMLFLMVTGAVQLILYVIYLCKWKSVHTELKPLFIIYGMLAMATLGILILQSSKVVAVSMTVGGFLAFFFLYLSYRQLAYHNLKLDHDEL